MLFFYFGTPFAKAKLQWAKAYMNIEEINMKTMTVAIPVLAITLLTGGFLASSHAQNTEAPAVKVEAVNKAYTEAQLQAAHKAREVSQDKMRPLQQDLFVKEQELRALQNATNPDVAAVSKKATEITQVRSKLQDEKKSLGLALDKALGLAPGTHGMHGKRGMHGMHRKGGHKGGYAEGYGRGHGKGRHYNNGDGHRRGHGRDENRGHGMQHDGNRGHDMQHNGQHGM